MIMGEPAVLTRLRPGQTADLGLTQYETFEGGWRKAMYGFRRFRDDRARTIEGSIRLAEIGLDPARTYVFGEPWASCADGRLIVKAALGPWGAKMALAEGR